MVNERTKQRLSYFLMFIVQAALTAVYSKSVEYHTKCSCWRQFL